MEQGIGFRHGIGIGVGFWVGSGIWYFPTVWVSGCLRFKEVWKEFGKGGDERFLCLWIVRDGGLSLRYMLVAFGYG